MGGGERVALVENLETSWGGIVRSGLTPPRVLVVPPNRTFHTQPGWPAGGGGLVCLSVLDGLWKRRGTGGHENKAVKGSSISRADFDRGLERG